MWLTLDYTPFLWVVLLNKPLSKDCLSHRASKISLFRMSSNVEIQFTSTSQNLILLSKMTKLRVVMYYLGISWQGVSSLITFLFVSGDFYRLCWAWIHTEKLLWKPNQSEIWTEFPKTRQTRLVVADSHTVPFFKLCLDFLLRTKI